MEVNRSGSEIIGGEKAVDKQIQSDVVEFISTENQAKIRLIIIINFFKKILIAVEDPGCSGWV